MKKKRGNGTPSLSLSLGACRSFSNREMTNIGACRSFSNREMTNIAALLSLIQNFHFSSNILDLHVWGTNPSKGFSCSSFFWCLGGFFPFRSHPRYLILQVKIVNFGRVNSYHTPDCVSIKVLGVIGLQGCMLCRNVVEDLAHFLLSYAFLGLVWSCFFEKFGFCLACQRTCGSMIREFFTHPRIRKELFCDGQGFVWFYGVKLEDLRGFRLVFEPFLDFMYLFRAQWSSLFVIIC